MRFFQQSEDIVNKLNEANELHCEIWRMWRYVKESSTLVLCGYNLPFDTKAFIVFRGISHICLGQWLEYAKFRLVNNFDEEFIAIGKDLEKDEHLIPITFSKVTTQFQYLICKEVAFLEIPIGAYV